MTIEKKISGWTVRDYGELEKLFDCCVISLMECIEKNLSQESMNWILDKLRFYKDESSGSWWATIDNDTNCKLWIIENRPDLAEQLKTTFGKNWMNYYLRFDH